MLASWKESYDKHKQRIKRQRHHFADKGPRFISVAQSYLTLCDPMDCSLPGSSVHGVFQARGTFVSKVMSLPFKTLSRFDVFLLPRSQHLLISWLQSLSTLILEPKKMKSDTVSTYSPSICHEV